MPAVRGLLHHTLCGAQSCWVGWTPTCSTPLNWLQAPQSRRRTQSQSQASKKEGAKGFIDKYADMSVHRDLPWGHDQAVDPPPPGLQPGDGPVQTPGHHCPATASSLPIVPGAGRGRGQPQAPGPWGSRVVPSPPGHWPCAPGQSQGRETAAASDPEQKTGVSTAISTRGQIWAPGASGLALVA